jgi:formylglycine-generating enzyme required for sulfatase activity
VRSLRASVSTAWIAAAAASVVALAALLAACQWIAGFQITGGGPDANGPTGSPCDVLPAKKVAAGGQLLVVKARPSPNDPPCFWMDETEVSVQDYGAWMSSADGGVGNWAGECAFKAGDAGPSASNPAQDPQDPCAATIPATEGNPFEPDKPIRCVDWCDSDAFCRAMGKRLCTGNDNESITADAVKGDEWGFGCSAGDVSVYPWGNDWTAGRCNVEQPPQCTLSLSCGPIPTTSFSDCRADGGPRDLIGNVAEWTHLCVAAADAGAAGDSCQRRGGSYDTTVDRAHCADLDPVARSHRDPQTGIRCCADLTADELHMLPL